MRTSSVTLFCPPVKSGTELPSMCKWSAAVHPVGRCSLSSASALWIFGQHFKIPRAVDSKLCPSIGAYWSEVGLGILLFLFFGVGWAFHSSRAALVLGKCPRRPHGRWTHNCIFPVGFRTCQTCLNAFWCLVLITGVYAFFEDFGILFTSVVFCVQTNSCFSCVLMKRHGFSFTGCLISNFLALNEVKISFFGYWDDFFHVLEWKAFVNRFMINTAVISKIIASGEFLKEENTDQHILKEVAWNLSVHGCIHSPYKYAEDLLKLPPGISIQQV